MKRRFSTIAGPVFGFLFLVVSIPVMTGCETFDLDWDPIEDTVVLFSLARPEYVDFPAAFDFYSRNRVVVEAPKFSSPEDFDVAFSEVDGAPVFLPAGLFATFQISPGIRMDSSGTPFDELARAPRDGYVTDAPVPVVSGQVYAVRTRTDRSGCSRYGKLEVLDVDPDGVVEFRQIRNRLCNDRELIPPDEE